MFMKKILLINHLFFINPAGLLLLSLASNSSFVSAQNEPRYSRMASLEASGRNEGIPERPWIWCTICRKTSTTSLKRGLPQLFIDGNRLDRAQVRQRLQKSFESIADSNAHKKATDTAIKQLSALARSEQISINGSINAALFLGELRVSKASYSQQHCNRFPKSYLIILLRPLYE